MTTLTRPRTWVALALGAIAAGLAAALLTLLLHACLHLATGGATEGYGAMPPWRRVAAPVAASALAACVWWWLRSRGPIISVDAVRKDPSKRMSLWRNLVDACTTVFAVGTGMAIGRETAPRQVAAAATDLVTRRLGLPGTDRGLVMSAAAAAGLAAVYNAPLAGVAYGVEVALVAWSGTAVALLLPCCVLATVIAWPVVGAHAYYPYPAGAAQADWWWGPALGVVAAVLGIAYRTLTERARDGHPKPHGWRLVAALAAAGLAMGVTTLWLPDVTGNGRAVIESALYSGPTVPALLGLLIAKPLLTSGFLRAGAVGGVLAPALAAGACAGGLLAHLAGQPALVPALAVTGAGAVLGITQRAPVFGALLAWELTHPPLTVTIALVVATVVAQLLVRSPLARRT